MPNYNLSPQVNPSGGYYTKDKTGNIIYQQAGTAPSTSTPAPLFQGFQKTSSEDVVRNYKGKILYTSEGDEVLVQGFVKRDPKHRILVYSAAQGRDYAVYPSQLSVSPSVFVSGTPNTADYEKLQAAGIPVKENSYTKLTGASTPKYQYAGTPFAPGIIKQDVAKRPEYYGSSSPINLTSYPYKIIPERETEQYKKAEQVYENIQAGNLAPGIAGRSAFGRAFMASHVTSPEKLGIYFKELSGRITPEEAASLRRTENIRQIARIQSGGAFPEYVRSPAFQVPAVTAIGLASGGVIGILTTKAAVAYPIATKLLGGVLVTSSIAGTGRQILEQEKALAGQPEYVRTGARATLAGSIIGGVAGGILGFRAGQRFVLNQGGVITEKPDFALARGEGKLVAIKEPGQKGVLVFREFKGKLNLVNEQKHISYPFEAEARAGYYFEPTKGEAGKIEGLVTSKTTPITSRQRVPTVTGEGVRAEGYTYGQVPGKSIQSFTGQAQNLKTLKLADVKLASKLIVPEEHYSVSEQVTHTLTKFKGDLFSGQKRTGFPDILGKERLHYEFYDIKSGGVPALKYQAITPKGGTTYGKSLFAEYKPAFDISPGKVTPGGKSPIINVNILEKPPLELAVAEATRGSSLVQVLPRAATAPAGGTVEVSTLAISPRTMEAISQDLYSSLLTSTSQYVTPVSATANIPRIVPTIFRTTPNIIPQSRIKTSVPSVYQSISATGSVLRPQVETKQPEEVLTGYSQTARVAPKQTVVPAVTQITTPATATTQRTTPLYTSVVQTPIVPLVPTGGGLVSSLGLKLITFPKARGRVFGRGGTVKKKKKFGIDLAPDILSRRRSIRRFGKATPIKATSKLGRQVSKKRYAGVPTLELARKRRR